MSLKMSTEAINQRAVKCSLILGFVIAVIGMLVGMIISSQVIFFTGFASMIGCLFTYIPLIALKYIKKKDVKKYPFGKEPLEPFIAIIQYIPLVFICAYNVFTAIQVILSGGNIISVDSGVLYGIFSATFNIITCGYLMHLTKKYSSPIAEAEVVGWKLEALVGGSLLLGFVVAWILEKLSFSAFIPYVDPVLTLILAVPYTGIPIVAFRDAMRELMQARPSTDIIILVTDKIEEINSRYDFSDKVLRIGKVGSKVIVEIDYIITKDSELDCVLEQDKLRKQLTQVFAEIPYKIWMNVNFTSDAMWTEHIVIQRF